MNLTLYLFFTFVFLLLLLLVWALRGPRNLTKRKGSPLLLEETGRRHVSFLPQIRQALARTDYDFLLERGLDDLTQRLRLERRQIALAYLSALRADFQKLLQLAKVLALLSPEVVALHELERIQLTVAFGWHFEMIRLQLRTGLSPVPRLSGLSDFVSGLSVRMETAMKELGERAVLAAELASSVDRRGSNIA